VRGVDSPKLVAMVCTCEGCAQSLLTPFDGVQIATSSATNSPHARGPHPPAISSARGPRTHCRVRLSRTHRAATFEMAMAWPGGRFAVGQQVYVRDAQHGWSPATVTVNSAPDTVRRLRPCGNVKERRGMRGVDTSTARTVGLLPVVSPPVAVILRDYRLRPSEVAREQLESIRKPSTAEVLESSIVQRTTQWVHCHPHSAAHSTASAVRMARDKAAGRRCLA
jgi:hypothetical protein